MTTTSVEVKEVPTPGTVIWVSGMLDPRDGHFGIVAPQGFWDVFATKRKQELFKKAQITHPTNPPLPIFLMHDDFVWHLHFAFLNYTIPHKNVFASRGVWEEYHPLFRSFTSRDGSRYYAEFFRQLADLVHFVFEEKERKYSLASMMENPQKDAFPLSLIEWREEQKPKPGSTEEVMSKTLELAREQLGNYKKGSPLEQAMMKSSGG